MKTKTIDIDNLQPDHDLLVEGQHAVILDVEYAAGATVVNTDLGAFVFRRGETITVILPEE